MPLPSGTRLGPYEVGAAIGAGGMGEVYRATPSGNVQYAQGHILFVRDGALMAWPFDAGRLETTGDPFPVADPVETLGTALLPFGLFSVSEAGLLAYRSPTTLTGTSRLTWLDREGAPLGTVGRPAPYVNVELSPNARYAALVAVLGEDLWIMDLDRGVDSRLASGLIASVAWSPDGDRVVFAEALEDTLHLAAPDGTGDETLPLEGSTSVADWTGDLILYARRISSATQEGALVRNDDLHVLPLTTGEPYPLLDSEFDEFPATFSPDGRWIAYVSNETGDSAVYVSRFTGTPGERPRGKVRVSPGPGLLPRWRGDREIFFYASDEDALMAAAVDGAGEEFQVGSTERLFRFGGRLSSLGTLTDYVYDVTPDGERVLALLSGPDEGEGAQPITVVSNWLGSAR